jgi:hypothetical protein
VVQGRGLVSSLNRLVPERNGVLTNYCKSELAIFQGGRVVLG